MGFFLCAVFVICRAKSLNGILPRVQRSVVKPTKFNQIIDIGFTVITPVLNMMKIYVSIGAAARISAGFVSYIYRSGYVWRNSSRITTDDRAC